jgi:hypothetical protein
MNIKWNFADYFNIGKNFVTNLCNPFSERGGEWRFMGNSAGAQFIAFLTA